MTDMPSNEISTENTGVVRHTLSRIDKNLLWTIILGLFTAAAILLFIFQVNRSLALRIEAAEVWTDYQVRIVKSTAEEDPNLRQQYAEEQDVLRVHAQDLKQRSSHSKNAVKFSMYAAVLLLFGTAVGVVGILAESRHFVYLGLLFGVVGVVLGFTTLI